MQLEEAIYRYWKTTAELYEAVPVEQVSMGRHLGGRLPHVLWTRRSSEVVARSNRSGLHEEVRLRLELRHDDPTDARARIDRIDAVLDRERLTCPDGEGTAHLALVEGSVRWDTAVELWNFRREYRVRIHPSL